MESRKELVPKRPCFSFGLNLNMAFINQQKCRGVHFPPPHPNFHPPWRPMDKDEKSNLCLLTLCVTDHVLFWRGRVVPWPLAWPRGSLEGPCRGLCGPPPHEYAPRPYGGRSTLTTTRLTGLQYRPSGVPRGVRPPTVTCANCHPETD